MSRPRLNTEANFVPGLAAVALFVVLAGAFLNAQIGDPQTFGGDAALTRSIGAALINVDPSAVISEGTAVPSEGFLVAFILVAVVLDAALDGSLMLAKRESTPDAVADGGEAGAGPGSEGVGSRDVSSETAAGESVGDGAPTDDTRADGDGGDAAW